MMTERSATKLKLMVDPKLPYVARTKSGMGWVGFSGGAVVKCEGCGAQVSTGYCYRGGGHYRCAKCVEFVAEESEL